MRVNEEVEIEPLRIEPRLQQIDLLKAMAIIAVVFTHAGHGRGAASGWDFAFTHAWVAFHVPTFLVLSGYLSSKGVKASGVTAATIGQRLIRVWVPYVLASGLVFALGFSRTVDVESIARALMTGSAFGIYYYIVGLTFCLWALYPVSRLPAAGVWVLIALLFICLVIVSAAPEWGFSHETFWRMRDPFASFYFGYFFVGFAAGRSSQPFASLVERHRVAIVCACLLGFAVWGVRMSGALPGYYVAVARVFYTFSVIGLVIALLPVVLKRAGRSTLPAAVRSISEATFCIYLYHRFFQISLQPELDGLHPLGRIFALVGVGVGGPLILVWLARKTIGPRRSKLFIGS